MGRAESPSCAKAQKKTTLFRVQTLILSLNSLTSNPSTASILSSADLTLGCWPSSTSSLSLFSFAGSRNTWLKKLDFAIFNLLHTGCFFLLVRPNFSAKKKNFIQATRIFCTSRISWNRISDWLPINFHFGTENWEDQLKKPPCR